jgi:hypothetical protein
MWGHGRKSNLNVSRSSFRGAVMRQLLRHVRIACNRNNRIQGCIAVFDRREGGIEEVSNDLGTHILVAVGLINQPSNQLHGAGSLRS